MKCLLKTLLLILSFTSLAHAASEDCAPQNFTFSLRKNLNVVANYYPSDTSRGVFIFIGGPEVKYKNPQGFVESLCQEGFSVSTFNLYGKKIKPKDYLHAAKLVTNRLRNFIRLNSPALSKLPMSVYGWSKGADVAVRLATLPRYYRFTNVVLDNPVLSSEVRSVVASGQVRGIKVFTCADDQRESAKVLRKLSYVAKIFETNGEECGPWLAASQGATAVLVDFIEGDYRQTDTSRKKVKRLLTPLDFSHLNPS